jgi:hypothetical protein
MSSNGAATCPVSHSQQKISTSQQMKNGADVNNIPPAHDLRSVITAINRMGSVINNITRGTPQVNNYYPTGSKGIPDPAPPPPFPGYEQMSWREVNREYGDGEIRSPHKDHAGQYVPVKVIKQVKWLDDITEHRVTYKGRS